MCFACSKHRFDAAYEVPQTSGPAKRTPYATRLKHMTEQRRALEARVRHLQARYTFRMRYSFFLAEKLKSFDVACRLGSVLRSLRLVVAHSEKRWMVMCFKVRH